MFNVEFSDDHDLADTLTLQDETKSLILKGQRTSRAEECRVSMIKHLYWRFLSFKTLGKT